jgi:hypothetical protein
MATRTGGKKELEQFLLEQCRQLCEFAANEVYEAINYFIAQYYSEDWDNRSYQRTEAFLRSAFKTEVKKVGNGYQAVVGIDYESLNEYENATGFQVVKWSNEGLHGGIDVGTNTHVWDDAMDSTINSGQLLSDCIKYLRSKGLTIIG